jgi:hypothetical protein
MNTFQRLVRFALTTTLVATISVVNPSVATADEEPMDVRHLQNCLKTKGASLDVLVLMDSSKSLKETDPGDKRDPILRSSLKLLQKLAEDSGSTFRINLKNFGDNLNSFPSLQSKWIDWTTVDAGNAKNEIDKFVKNALYDDSPGTQWARGLATAKTAFNARINQAKDTDTVSCSIMFWITDGFPDKENEEKNEICSPNSDSSIQWFRQKNILVLGGLLKPKGTRTSIFGPIVTGKDGCGEREDAWTKGSVVESDDINSLAWEFVGLVANIKNLVDLEANNGKVALDRGTSQLEIFIKGKEPSQWQLFGPDGALFCSKTDVNQDKCRVIPDVDNIGITTITVIPANPDKSEGDWTFKSDTTSEVKIFGGINVEPNSIKLIAEISNPNIIEGRSAQFLVKLVNPDGKTLFDVSGFRSVEICATLDSNKVKVCKTGSGSANIELFPSEGDVSVPFTAVLTSKNGTKRQYYVSTSVNVFVQKSGKFPSLVCGDGSEGDTCKIPNLNNKSSSKSVQLKVLAPTDGGAVSGQIYLIGVEVTRDDYSRKFDFIVTDNAQNVITPGDESALFDPGDILNLAVSFDKDGESKIEGVIKYAVVVEGKTVLRQLEFGFNVDDKINIWLLMLMFALAYLLTVGVPYAFLLWRARRGANFSPPDNEIAFITTSFAVDADGRFTAPEISDSDSESFDLHSKLTRLPVNKKSRSVTVGELDFKVKPPKNPFTPTITTVTQTGHYLLSTVGSREFCQNATKFSQSLANEAVLYFSIADNLNPLEVSSTAVEVDQYALIPTSAYETDIKKNYVSRQDGISGKILIIVPSYGTKVKLLRGVISKIEATCAGVEFSEVISALRKEILEKNLADIAARGAIVEGNDKEPEEANPKAEIEWEEDSESWAEPKSRGQGLLDGISDIDSSSGDGSWK